MPHLAVDANDITVVRVTRRLFDALDSVPAGDLTVPGSQPVDPLTALLAVRNCLMTVGAMAIAAGGEEGADEAAQAHGHMSAVEQNREMVLRIVGEAMTALAGYAPKPEHGPVPGRSRIVTLN